MSEKTADSANNKRFSKVLKWSGVIVGIVALELAGIFSAVKITESRNADRENQFQTVLKQLQKQASQIDNLEKFPLAIAANADKIAANISLMNVVTQDLRALKEEVGNNKLEQLNQHLSKLNHRVESVEESKSLDTLVLSLALIIKENALYNRSFAKEADILAELSQEQENIVPLVQELVSLKDRNILSDTQLIEQYRKIADNFTFSNGVAPTDSSEKENRNAVAKSIELIKDTVSGISFNKVVVMKKEKKTDEQELLLNTLTELINTHNFKDALTFIEQNRTAFHEELNPEFTQWVEMLSQKVTFDKSISQIIASELSAIRKDFAAKVSSQTPSED